MFYPNLERSHNHSFICIQEFEDAVEVVETPPSPGPPVSPIPNGTTKKTKMDKLKKLNPVSLKKSPRAEKRQGNAGNEEGNESIPLHESIEDARRALDLFLNNEFVASKQIVEPL